MGGVPKRLGELLTERKLITEEQLQRALEEQKRSGDFLGEVLIRRGYIKEQDLLTALSEQYDIPFVSLRDKYIDWNLVKRFTPSLILDHKCFPLAENEFALTVAVVNPLDVWVLKKAEEEARGLKLKLVLVSRADMSDVIERYRQFAKGGISKLF